MASTSMMSSATFGTDSVAVLPQTADVELNIRILKAGRENIQRALLQQILYQADTNQTIVKEVIQNGQVKEVKICLLKNANDVTCMMQSQSYAFVNRLEVSTAAPCNRLFYWVSCLPMLKLLSLGPGFFGNCKEAEVWKIERSASVTDLVIQFDKVKYDSLLRTEQSRIKNKVDYVLGLAYNQLPNLSFLDLVLPCVEPLDIFLNKRQNLKFSGEKTENFAQGIVTFRTIRSNSQNCEPKPGPSLRRPYGDNLHKKAKRAKMDPMSFEVVPKPGVSLIEVEYLAESSSDDEKKTLSLPEPNLHDQSYNLRRNEETGVGNMNAALHYC